MPSLDVRVLRETMAPMTTLRRAALLGCVTLLAASVARAQVEPPSATSPGAPTMPPGAAPPPAPAAVDPVAPLSPTMATEPLQPAPRPKPFYEKWWFWGGASVVVATLVLILVWNLSSNDNGPPNTTFGNMHAF